MSIPEIHARLADSATIFVAVLGLWALLLRFRARPLDNNWVGAAVVGELLLVAQGLLGVYLYYVAGAGAALPRPFMHILYGIVAVLTLPAAHSYFGQLEDEKVKSLAMAAACFFLWGIVLRASQVAQYAGPGV
jgi:phosphatidylglycerophosphate synthase